MYSLDNKDFEKSFDTINELLNYVLSAGVDPNYEVTKNGKGIGEELADFIIY